MPVHATLSPAFTLVTAPGQRAVPTGAGAFLPENGRQRDLVGAGALIRVDEVDAGRVDLDERFSRLRDSGLERLRTGELRDRRTGERESLSW